MRPAQTPLIAAAAFLALSIIYIIGSDWLALRFSQNIQQFHEMQSLKGIFYVGSVALGLFGLTHVLLRRIEEKDEALQAEREALLSAERRTVAGTLAATIAHDVNNLLSVVRCNLSYAIEDGLDDPSLREPLIEAHDATDSLIELNQRLIKAAKRKTGERLTTTSLTRLVAETLELIQTHSKLTERRLETSLDEEFELPVFPDLITHAVINLILNASDATEPGGIIGVSISTSPEWAYIVVEDSGPGLSDEQKERILQPFYTTKSTGTGLGLFSVCYCAESHGGTFHISESEWGGAKMTLALPR